MNTFSTILTEGLDAQLTDALLRSDHQEDLCFATYVPSSGASRFTGILSTAILPQPGERQIHGNASFNPQYLERSLEIASKRGEGLAFLHSHLGPGWQNMSSDDIRAEDRLSPAVTGATGLPLLGLTMGTDGAWSSRYWTKDPTIKRLYHRKWSESVRVFGKRLRTTFNDRLLPAQLNPDRQLRTISAWGACAHADLSRLRVGIVGLGSVGSMVAEILARIGISRFSLIDFDVVECKNLDRLTNIFTQDIGRAKVQAIKDAIRRSASAPHLDINPCQFSICEKEGFDAALDCDILLCCVDRPWPRQVLNFIAYAHLIPVIDGGILVRTNPSNTRLLGADWKVQVVGPGRACLECLGQYSGEEAATERAGYFDDPVYIKGLPAGTHLDAHENVFAFSAHLASMEVFQLLRLVLSPGGVSDVGQQTYHFVTGIIDVDPCPSCKDHCFLQTIVGKGDRSGVTLHAEHRIAREAREACQLNRAPTAPPARSHALRGFIPAFIKQLFRT